MRRVTKTSLLVQAAGIGTKLKIQVTWFLEPDTITGVRTQQLYIICGGDPRG